MDYKGTLAVSAKDRQAWRDWLAAHHETTDAVWLVIFKKDSGIPSVYYPEAVDEALCFGWVDSLPNKRDAESYYQYFSQRNPKSNWSRFNKKKVQRLIEAGRMAPAGLAMIEIAKTTGTWGCPQRRRKPHRTARSASCLYRQPYGLRFLAEFSRFHQAWHLRVALQR